MGLITSKDDDHELDDLALPLINLKDQIKTHVPVTHPHDVEEEKEQSEECSYEEPAGEPGRPQGEHQGRGEAPGWLQRELQWGRESRRSRGPEGSRMRRSRCSSQM